LSQWNINAENLYALNNISFYSSHPDDTFCAFLPHVKAVYMFA